MAIYYVRNGGNDGASGLSDALAWATFNNINPSKINPGDSVFVKRGSLWRMWWGPDFSGTSSDPITLGVYGEAGDAKISGANLITGWTVYSGLIWQATGANSEGNDPGELYADGTHCTRKTSIGACVAEGDWFWSGGILYLYAPTDPDTRYTNPGVEMPYWQQVIMFNSSYWIFDGLLVEKSWGDNFRSYAACGHNIIRNCTSQWGGAGIGIAGGNAHVGSELYGNVCRYNGESGIYANQLCTWIKIYRNEVYHNGDILKGDAYSNGIKFWGDGLDYIEVYENYIHHNEPVGLWFDGATCANYSQTHHNRIEDCSGEGLMLELSKNIRNWNNLIVNCGTQNIGEGEAWASAGVLITGRLDFHTDGNLIYGHTIYGANIGINVWQDGYGYTTGTISNNLIKNNIVADSITRPLSCGQGGDNNPAWNSNGNTYLYNNFGPQSSSFIRWARGGYYSTYLAWEGADGIILEGGSTHSINADPKLHDPTNGNLTLDSDSPCIDMGTNLGNPYNLGLRPEARWPGQ